MMNASAALTAFSFTCCTPPSLFRASLPKGSASDRSLKALKDAAIARVAELEDGGDPRTSMADILGCTIEFEVADYTRWTTYHSSAMNVFVGHPCESD